MKNQNFKSNKNSIGTKSITYESINKTVLFFQLVLCVIRFSHTFESNPCESMENHYDFMRALATAIKKSVQHAFRKESKFLTPSSKIEQNIMMLDKRKTHK